MLSPQNRELAELLRSGALPNDARLDPQHLVPYLSGGYYAFSCWPIFLDPVESRRVIGPIVANIPRIFYAALRARFGEDCGAFEAYFGWPADLYEVLLHLPVDPRDVHARYDAVFDGQDFKLLELNAGTSCGGWQVGNWIYPHMRELLARDPRSAVWGVAEASPVEPLLRLMVENMRRRNGGRRGGHVLMHCFANTPEGREPLRRYLQQVYDRCKPAEWPQARIFLFTEFSEISFPHSGDVIVEGQRMDAVVMCFPPVSGVPQEVADALNNAYLRARIVYPDSPFHTVIGDKRMFALVHECCRDGLLDPADIALVRRYVPWSTLLQPGPVSWRGRTAPLDKLLREEREHFVLKKADSYGGQDVFVGRQHGPEDWARAMQDCLQQGRWIVQEYCAPGRMELHDSLQGLAPHELIWGLFAAGMDYSGAFVRARRCDISRGVINSANGATEFLVLDQVERTTEPPGERLAAALAGRGAQAGDGLDLRAVSVPLFLRDYAFPVSAWPAFLPAATLRNEIEPLLQALPGLMYRAIGLHFGDDSEAFSDYFGWPAGLLPALRETPPDPAETLVRYDAVLADAGLQLLELNCCSSIGGWLHDWLAAGVQARLDSLGGDWNVRYRGVFAAMLEHAFERLQVQAPAGAVGNVLVHADARSSPAVLEDFRQRLQAVYDQVRPAQFAAGRILVCTRADAIVFGSDAVRHDGQRVDVVLLSFAAEGELSDAFYERLTAARLRNQLVTADAHFHRVLGDKRLFAVLHECLRDGRLSTVDAELVRRHVPWTARVSRATASWNGDSAALPVLLRRHREQLVLKRASSFGGKDVFVGRFVSAAAWAAALDRALGDGDWIAQAYTPPARELLCARDSGLAPHDVIWGFFAFGGRYAGAFVRARAAGGGSGVINSANGATEFVVLEEIERKKRSRTFEGEFSRLNLLLNAEIQRNPAMRAERLRLNDPLLPSFLHTWTIKFGAWPLIADKDFARRRFTTVVEKIPPILFKAMRQYFGSDSQAFSDFYGVPAVLYDILCRQPVDPRELHARYDAVINGDGLRLLEINCTSAAGGFQLDWAEPGVSAALQRYAVSAALPIRHHSVFKTQFRSLIDAMLRRSQRPPSGNVLLYSFVPQPDEANLQQCMQQGYDALKPAELAAGKLIVFTDFGRFSFDANGDTRYDGELVDAVLFSFPSAVHVPEETYRRLSESYLRGRLVFPDSPIHALLDTKKQFALAHECCERGLLDAHERAIIREYIPWTARLADTEVSWRGRHLPLQQLLREQQALLVLKKAESFGGRDVILGRNTDAAEWGELVQRHLAEGGWLVQEYCAPGRILFPDPELGVVEHDLIWGIFTFGGRYGGTFMRAKAVGLSDGIVNTASGAMELLLYEGGD